MTLSRGAIQRCEFCGATAVEGVTGARGAICQACVAKLVLVAEEIAVLEAELGPSNGTLLGCPFCGDAAAHPLVCGEQLVSDEPARICVKCIRASAR